MGAINVLDSQVANLIAAGEVVDRPGSVIKELVENSMDAGATTITVEIKHGGITFMRVTDNGSGIERDDVPLALKRHATSKIQKASDLDSIYTMGFRGEALAAISSVSKVRIMTKRCEDSMGTILTCEGPDIIDISEAACQNGTTVIIEDLFYNVPARRKFLKKDVSEGMYVTSVMERLCLSRPDISFKYICDGATKFATPGSGRMLDAMFAVFGRDFAKKTIQVSTGEDHIKIKGYIGTPENVRGNSNLQIFFINRRFVRSKTAYAALKQAFDSYIPKERFPVCVIEITTDPRFVDVNVHPSKLEVKFSNEKMIFDLIYFAVRSALVKGIERPSGTLNRHAVDAVNSFVPLGEPQMSVKQSQITLRDFNSGGAKSVLEREEAQRDERITEPTYEQRAIAFSAPKRDNPIELPKESKQDFSWDDLPVKADNIGDSLLPLPDYKIIGEVFYSYVLLELDNKMIVVDKHAAHERILFEDMKRNMQKSGVESQVLLVPLEVPLDAYEMAAVKDFAEDIKKIGFDLSLDEENHKVLVAHIPTILSNEDVSAFIQGLASALADGTVNISVTKEALYEKSLYQASCKAAIKAGRIYDMANIKWICDKLLVLPNIKYCPHGRPVAFEISRTDLERQFKRI